ncbi:tripartite tricarboxylate transporter permease [Candidatus Pacearchaeota archaeon]|nr:tripartite tricarboxylate transporter permease [Candidatus Pacearchaeota archaeon]
MLIQILLAIFAGTFTGVLTGLIPGIHVNLIGVFLISLSSTLLFNINPLYLVIFIVAIAITHIFIDFIPSIFLGCPDTDTELSVLPGHEMLKKGEGYEAIMLAASGSLAAVFILILIFYPSLWFFPKIYTLTKNIIPYILIAVSGILILMEKNKFYALLVFLLTGILGFGVLNLHELKEPLLPLLTGLFGSSMLLMSIKNKPQIPEQKTEFQYEKKKIFKPVFGAFISSPLLGFLPALGSGQAAILGQTIVNSNKNDNKSFLILLGATNIFVMGFSFITLYLISKTRTGAAYAIEQLLGSLSLKILILILMSILISGIIAFFTTKYLAKIFSSKINQINYSLLSKIALIILAVIVFLVSGFLGLLILILSTLTGIYCLSLDVKRTNMMGCLLIPTILFYLWGM